MGDGKAIFEELKKAIIAYDMDQSKALAQKIIDEGLSAIEAIDAAIGGAAPTLAEKFESGEYYLPHLVMAADAMEAAGEILEQGISKEDAPQKKVCVIGTVEADLHSVGKTIVAMMLRANGFEVHDLGVDVKSTAFISKAAEVNADLIALSSLLTTTMPYMREVIEDLETQGTRGKYKVLVGGGPVTKEFAERIGADGQADDAVEGVRVARSLTGMR